MKKFLGLIVSLALLMGLLAGCAGTPAKDNISNTPAPAGTGSPQPGGKDAEKSVWPKTIKDAAGNEVVLKEQPKRIAILHSLYLEYFFALETPPAASTGSSTGNAMKALEEWETLKAYTGKADIIDLGSARDLNMEAILEAKPDVIVTFKGHVDKIYEQLVQIAPVVQVDFNAPWQAQLSACAEVVGKEAFAAEFIRETEEIISSAKEKLSKYSGKTIAIFRASGKAFATRATKEYYKTFGISRPEGYPDNYETLSLEAVSGMDPDYMVFQDFMETSQAFVKTQEASSVWQAMKAVKNGKIFYFNDSLNTFGPLAMRLTAEKLVKVFSEQ